MSKIIALIPARGGSKGIKYKNIVALAGKPLLSYSIIAAQQSEIFNAIYVSSDDAKILSVANDYNASLVHRSPKLAQDHSPTNDLIEEFITNLELADDDVIVLLQPTSPLRSAEHIKSAVTLFKQKPDCSALISVCAADNKYLYTYLSADSYLTPVSPEHMKISRRQDLPEIYLPNGAIYIFTVGNFKREKSIPENRLVAYVMSAEDSIDIDAQKDLDQAEIYFTQRAGN